MQGEAEAPKRISQQVQPPPEGGDGDQQKDETDGTGDSCDTVQVLLPAQATHPILWADHMLQLLAYRVHVNSSGWS
jgi:hypothetical protein